MKKNNHHITIHHIHLPICESTQIFLKENLSKLTSQLNTQVPILVSCDKQTKGIGRNGNQWMHFESSLAFSFTFPPHNEITLSSLLISLFVLDYFEENFKIKLQVKWPNDIFDNSNKKCGGIITHLLHQNSEFETLIVGIGLNLWHQNESEWGSIFNTSFTELKNKINPLDLVNYCYDKIDKYQDSKILRTKWIERCFHLHQPVKIVENSQTIGKGYFIGIGEKGEALIETLNQNHDNKIEHFYSGSLLFDAH
jgi:BirA family biotin operon repressor/biotin-[acetyl-CoA-carboxylase] ligase